MASSYAAARDRPVLSVGPVTYRWSDVEALARRMGRWPAFEQQVRSGLAALAVASQGGAAPTADAVAEAGRAFRRRRRLHAAEDMERWLADRRLTVADWRGWLQVQVAREGAPTEDGPHPAEGDLDAARWVDGVCSGTLRGLAEQLAAAAAIHAVAAESDDSLHRTSAPPPAELVAVYDRILKSLERPEQLRQAVRDHRLEWTRIRAEAVTVETDDIAREAAAGLADGQGIAAVAALAGTAVIHVDGPLAQVPEHLRSAVLAAPPGGVVGPIRTDDGWTALRLLDRRRPSLEQPWVHEAARRTVHEQLITREVAARVTWHERV